MIVLYPHRTQRLRMKHAIARLKSAETHFILYWCSQYIIKNASICDVSPLHLAFLHPVDEPPSTTGRDVGLQICCHGFPKLKKSILLFIGYCDGQRVSRNGALPVCCLLSDEILGHTIFPFIRQTHIVSHMSQYVTIIFLSNAAATGPSALMSLLQHWRCSLRSAWTMGQKGSFQN